MTQIDARHKMTSWQNRAQILKLRKIFENYIYVATPTTAKTSSRSKIITITYRIWWSVVAAIKRRVITIICTLILACPLLFGSFLVALLGDSLAIKACSFPWNLDCFDVPCPLHSVIAAQKMRLSYIKLLVDGLSTFLPWGHFGKLSFRTLKISWNCQLTSEQHFHLQELHTMKEWHGGNIFGPFYILNFQTNDPGVRGEYDLLLMRKSVFISYQHHNLLSL